MGEAADDRYRGEQTQFAKRHHQAIHAIAEMIDHETHFDWPLHHRISLLCA